MIRGEIKLTPPQQLDGAQISPLRATGGPQLGDTMSCLKTIADGRIAFIAVFLEGGKILSYRRAVAYDRCAQADYAPLAAPPRPQAVRVKPARGKPTAKPIADPLAMPSAQPPEPEATAD